MGRTVHVPHGKDINMLGKKAVIGISALLYEESRDYRCTRSYAEAVAAVGGIPVMLPAAIVTEDAELLLPGLDGVLIPGGADVDPLLYGEEPLRELGLVKTSNDLFELRLLRAAREARKPILCICRGEQVLNVAFGGTLYQDLPSQLPRSLRHRQTPVSASDPTHSIDILRGTLLYNAYGVGSLTVNSFHHQAVKELAPGFRVSARAKDGVIEAIECTEERIIGVQWHPEAMYLQHPDQLGLFRQLVQAAADRG